MNYDAIRPFANDAITFELEGPAEIIGDNPFALVVGTGAIWIRTKEQPGTVRLTATHPVLGKQMVEFHDCRGGSGSRLTSIVNGVILNGLQAVKDLARIGRNVGPQRPRRTWDL